MNNDIVIGRVLKILDSDTFSMITTKVGKTNRLSYNDFEMIMPSTNSTGLNMNKLRGFEIRCYIHQRDSLNRLIADIELA